MINLLPPEHREFIEYGRKNKRITSWLSALLFGIIILFAVAVVGRLTIQTAKNQAYSQKTSAQAIIDESNLSSVEKNYTDYVNGLSSTRKVYEKQILYSRLIQKLATLLPPGTSLTTISLTDKDRAINLNFDNQIDGLGPIIQTNLLNQGDQIAEKNRQLTESGFNIPLGGKLELNSRGELKPVIKVDPTSKTIEYFISAPDDPSTKNDIYDTYSASLANGGEYAYRLAYPTLFSDGYLYWLSLGKDEGSKIPKGSPLPQLLRYSINEDAKFVDFTVNANSMIQAKIFEDTLNKMENSIFIDSYIFEDRAYTLGKSCHQEGNQKNDQACSVVCNDGSANCKESMKICSPKVEKGCQYIIRAYYDELVTGATIEKLDDKTKSVLCPSGDMNYRACTHRVVATYEPLFNEVDINRVSACTIPSDSLPASCPVEIRAEFGQNAKFYLINGATN